MTEGKIPEVPGYPFLFSPVKVQITESKQGRKIGLPADNSFNCQIEIRIRLVFQDIAIDSYLQGLLEIVFLPVHGENHDFDRWILRFNDLGGCRARLTGPNAGPRTRPPPEKISGAGPPPQDSVSAPGSLLPSDASPYHDCLMKHRVDSLLDTTLRISRLQPPVIFKKKDIA
jgi:hypothetical protein